MLLPTKWQPHNSLHWDENSPCVALRTDDSLSRVLVFADYPIPNFDALDRDQDFNTVVYYFEIEILSINDGGSSEIAIGLAPVESSHDGKMHIDAHNSFLSTAYSNTGTITRGSTTSTVIKFGTRDVIGCGCEIGGDRKVFFTCNGKIIPDTNTGGESNDEGAKYFPAVELLGIGTAIR